MNTCADHRHDAPDPSPWVARYLAGVEAGGHVLDLACGHGRHLRYALERGYRVTGLDRNISRLGDLEGDERVRLIEADLETGAPFPLSTKTFDGVIVVNYLWRPVLGPIVTCVAPDGVLIYETFARGNERYGKPANPKFLLKSNELIKAVVPELIVVAYEHGSAQRPYPRVVQRIAACGREHPWAATDPAALPESG